MPDRESSRGAGPGRYDASTSVDGNADPPGPNQLRGTFIRFKELKHLYPDLKIQVSFAGWRLSAGFTSAASDHISDAGEIPEPLLREGSAGGVIEEYFRFRTASSLAVRR